MPNPQIKASGAGGPIIDGPAHHGRKKQTRPTTLFSLTSILQTPVRAGLPHLPKPAVRPLSS
jgi:hypothetical protein